MDISIVKADLQHIVYIDARVELSSTLALTLRPCSLTMTSDRKRYKSAFIQ